MKLVCFVFILILSIIIKANGEEGVRQYFYKVDENYKCIRELTYGTRLQSDLTRPDSPPRPDPTFVLTLNTNGNGQFDSSSRVKSEKRTSIWTGVKVSRCFTMFLPLQEHPDKFKEYHWMTIETYDYILGAVVTLPIP
ncbi:unnamed protein product [Timema podura]|uniref:Uncharacterized protein n=1 Tax=Timema podura TaxID=61482 RepID=A0ABN7PC78_TIMPD|nr:unnamed protein product [Timema podura]